MRKSFFLIVLIFCLLVLPVSAAFSDIYTNDYSLKTAVDYVVSQGIVKGYSDGTFRPGDKITRSQLIKILVAAQYPSDEINKCIKSSTPTYIYSDISARNIIGLNNVTVEKHIFADFICMAKMNNISNGYSDGTFKPDNNVTFAEAVKMIAQVFELADPKTAKLEYNNSFELYIDALAEKNYLTPYPKGIDDYVTRREVVEMIYRIKNNITNLPSTQIQYLLPSYRGMIRVAIGSYDKNGSKSYFVEGNLPLSCNPDSYCEGRNFTERETTFRLSKDAVMEYMDCSNNEMIIKRIKAIEAKQSDIANLCVGGEAIGYFSLEFDMNTKEVILLKHEFI